MKICARCKVNKPHEEFYTSKSDKTGFQSYCKECDKVAIHLNVLRTRGLTLQDYEEAFEQQGGVCAICHKSEGRRLSIDHDHTTGAFRGLLCRGCNLILGNAQDSTLTLESAIKYLKEVDHGQG